MNQLQSAVLMALASLQARAIANIQEQLEALLKDSGE